MGLPRSRFQADAVAAALPVSPGFAMLTLVALGNPIDPIDFYCFVNSKKEKVK